MVEKRPYPGDHAAANGNKRPATHRPPHDALAAAKARAAEIAAAMQAKKAAASRPTAHGASPSPAQGAAVAPPQSNQTQPAAPPTDKLAAMKARIAALKGAPAAAPSTDAPPVRPPASYTPPTPRTATEAGHEDSRKRGDDGRSKKREPMAPRFATTLANRRTDSPIPEKKEADRPGPATEEVKENPYFDPHYRPTKRDRLPRALVFNQRGKYLAQATKMRQQERLEQIKIQISKQARQAGLDENTERGFLVQMPPDVEWWDEGLLEDKNYESIEDPVRVRIETEDSLITSYIQHPVILKAPQDQLLIQVKPMYLTPKEQAKVRRMRRAADLKEHQAKIRLGLEPPPPPKVKRGNMMRVMGEQAIADPTAVEMLVEKQIQERQDTHIKANEERKLTKDERLAKLAENQQKDAQKGLHMCVFKIDTLAFGKHRYLIDHNAKEHNFTGITIFNPTLNLVIVEGGLHSMQRYKTLLLRRIKWNENAFPTEKQAEKLQSNPPWMRSVDDENNLKDLSSNQCSLIFEGQLKQRAFRKWAEKICETDGEAKEVLARAKLDSLWALAKSSD
ncbi:pre-mRNA processing factor 3-domain-containing protein [Clohesyomyces aquaticus]|uniref:Pre-mRNA processing factor 3-domain-containing protein n=1 Tax=Clohesyomyces aquaticus TaxID=1231657 RepID=A0A1Y1ZAE6_9PLEO|nr:pre-mRNA processing factor 3-domain-containing protein [Clohesyomyces aquaticus]